MKKLILLSAILLVSVFAVNAQDANLASIQKYNFGLSDNTEVFWQKVFTSNHSHIEIRDALIGANLFDRILSDKENQIIGTLLPIKSRYKDMGKGWMSTDFIASEVEIWGRAVVDIRDSVYRVTLSNITFKATVSPSAYSSPTSFESIFLKRNGQMRRVGEENLDIYNYTFEKNFTTKSNPNASDNW